MADLRRGRPDGRAFQGDSLEAGLYRRGRSSQGGQGCQDKPGEPDHLHEAIVQEMLGHATISQTMDTYSHVMPGMQDAAVTAMESVLS